LLGTFDDLGFLTLLQDAYFSKGSRFDKTQSCFTDKPLKKSVFLHFAQNKLDSLFHSNPYITPHSQLL